MGSRQAVGALRAIARLSGALRGCSAGWSSAAYSSRLPL